MPAAIVAMKLSKFYRGGRLIDVELVENSARFALSKGYKLVAAAFSGALSALTIVPSEVVVVKFQY